MRWTRSTLLLLTLIVFRAVAADGDLTGRWTAQAMAGAGGAEQKSKATFVLDADGAKLSGTLENPLGKFALNDGKVEDKSVTFWVDMAGTRVEYDGLLTDEGLDFIATFIGRDRSDHFVATRRDE